MNATVRQRDRFRTVKREKGRKPIKLHVGVETLRTGYCPDHRSKGGHPCQSTRFIGVNEKWWIFFCAAHGHYFINQPPGTKA